MVATRKIVNTANTMRLIMYFNIRCYILVLKVLYMVVRAQNIGAERLLKNTDKTGNKKIKRF